MLFLRNPAHIIRRYPHFYRPLSMSLEKPLCDSREYDQLRLSNGIIVTLIRDTNLARSSCALAVNVGASADPLAFPGLAHFTEHMLFLGTEKYPKENCYKDFLNSHGGSSNASTSMEATVYKFDVNHSQLSTSIDIFSQFFKSPLLGANSAVREIKAVDAEDAKNRSIDGRRTLQILKCLINPSSAYSKYSTGNIHTLARGDADSNSEYVREAMVRFYEKWYRTEQMAVALVGPQTLEEMRVLAIDNFSDILHQIRSSDANSSDKVLITTDKILEVSQKSYPFIRGGVAVYTNPVAEINRVDVMWGMPSTAGMYRANPCRLIGHILGHEGEGSLFAYLQGRGWVTALSAGTRTSFVDFSIFQVSLSVTPDGLKHWKDVVGVVYSHIHLMSRMSDEQILETWREEKACDDLSFKFQMKQSAREKAANVAQHTLMCAPEHVLSYGYIRDEVDIPTLRRFIARMVPGQEVCLIASKNFSWISSHDAAHGQSAASAMCDAYAGWGEKANRVEPWYGVHYYEETIAESDLQLWRSSMEECLHALRIPDKNVYIPYSLLESDNSSSWRSDGLETPLSSHKLLNNFPEALTVGDDLWTVNCPSVYRRLVKGSCWWSEDLLYRHPRSCVFVLIETSALAAPSCRISQVNALLRKTFAQITASKRYPSTIAGLHNSVAWTYRGLELQCYGYSPHLGILLDDILTDARDFLVNASPDEEARVARVLENVKDKHMRALRSWRSERPDSICSDALMVLLQDHSWFPDDQLGYVQDVDIATLRALAQNSFQQANAITLYSHGDITKEAAGDLFSLVAKCAIPVIGAHGVDEPCSVKKTVIQGARLIPKGSGLTFLFPAFNPRDANSALVCHFQAGSTPSCATTDALLMVLNRILKEPLFTELRTQQQIGYIVSLSQDVYGRGYGQRLGGLTVQILSKRFHPLHIKVALGRFMASQREFLANMSDSELASRVAAIIANLEEPPSTYSAEASRNWAKLIDGYPSDYKLQVIAALKEVTLPSVLNAAESWIFNRHTRQCAIVMICAAAHEKDMIDAFTAAATPTPPGATEEFAPEEPFFDPIDSSSKMYCDLREILTTKDTLQYPLNS